MNEHKLTLERIDDYARHLHAGERAPGTVEKYLRDIRAFAAWLDNAAATKEVVTERKEHLRSEQYAPSTINGALAALNGLFHFLGWADCRTKFLKVQRRLFRDSNRELTRGPGAWAASAGAADGDHLCYGDSGI